MLFFVKWSVAPGLRNAANERFLQSADPPPEGVRVIGRWAFTDTQNGFNIVECSDALVLAAWSQRWSDLLTMEVEPVITLEDAAKVVAG